MVYMPDDSTEFEPFLLNALIYKPKNKFAVFTSPSYNVFVIAVD